MFKDVARGKLASRARWDACPSVLKAGDTLVAVKLDMFGRSVSNLQEIAQDFAARNISLMCLDQPIDTTSAQGKLFFTILATFAEFERDLISGRTRDGLAATKARGRNGGRARPQAPRRGLCPRFRCAWRWDSAGVGAGPRRSGARHGGEVRADFGLRQ